MARISHMPPIIFTADTAQLKIGIRAADIVLADVQSLIDVEREYVHLRKDVAGAFGGQISCLKKEIKDE